MVLMMMWVVVRILVRRLGLWKDLVQTPQMLLALEGWVVNYVDLEVIPRLLTGVLPLGVWASIDATGLLVRLADAMCLGASVVRAVPRLCAVGVLMCVHVGLLNCLARAVQRVDGEWLAMVRTLEVSSVRTTLLPLAAYMSLLKCRNDVLVSLLLFKFMSLLMRLGMNYPKLIGILYSCWLRLVAIWLTTDESMMAPFIVVLVV